MDNELVVYEEVYKGYTIKIMQDDEPDNPREWDNAGKMVCWHNRYNLGDEQPRGDPEDWLKGQLMDDYTEDYLDDKSMDDLLALFQKKNIILPLYLYDHSGITISTSRTYPYNDRWDSGQVGWIYISHKNAVKEWGRKLYTKSIEARAVKCLQGEVLTYDDYLTGNVYGYIVEDQDGEHLDSCWGFYPDHDKRYDYQYCLDEARSVVDYRVRQEQDKAYKGLACMPVGAE